LIYKFIKKYMGLFKDIIKDNKKILLLTLGLLIMSVVGAFLMNNGIISIAPTLDTRLYTQPEDMIEDGVDYKAIIKTVFGDIKIDLYEEDSPNAVNSFIFLASKDFYNDLTFHRVVPNFLIQAGDHLGNGEGNPGYDIDKDVNNLEFKEYDMGMVNGSQFFIVANGANLDDFNSYTVMGSVESGFSVVDAIEKVNTRGEKPVNDVTISSVLISEE
jgi:peptidyl-prolyl cis-trans isomerase B (cyclophilin B)